MIIDASCDRDDYARSPHVRHHSVRSAPPGPRSADAVRERQDQQPTGLR